MIPFLLKWAVFFVGGRIRENFVGVYFGMILQFSKWWDFTVETPSTFFGAFVFFFMRVFVWRIFYTMVNHHGKPPAIFLGNMSCVICFKTAQTPLATFQGFAKRRRRTTSSRWCRNTFLVNMYPPCCLFRRAPWPHGVLCQVKVRNWWDFFDKMYLCHPKTSVDVV